MDENKELKMWKKLLIVLGLGIIVGGGLATAFIIIKTKDKEPTSVMQSDVESDLAGATANREEKEHFDDPSAKELNVTSSDLSDLVENVMPSVVTISCKTITQSSYSDPFAEIFGYGFDYGYDYGYDYGAPIESLSSGTGFVIGQNGDELLLATNAHVVEGANEVSVKFIDGVEAEATIKGMDTAYDVAVISVDGSKLSEDTLKKIRIATIGSSDDLIVGDMLVAIGNSLGKGQSVTVGYVSALDRKVTVDNREMHLIQTDTVINSGNSGGPLLNVNGEVVGITNAKTTTSYSSLKIEGMSYAVPISDVIPIINELMNRVDLSPAEVGYLGIEGKEISASYSKAFNMPQGLYVSKINKDSPALAAGIRKGDIITALNGKEIKNMDDLKEMLSYIKYGTEVEIKYSTLGNNGYAEQTTKVVLGKRSIFEEDRP